jgi:hypothetical protein
VELVHLALLPARSLSPRYRNLSPVRPSLKVQVMLLRLVPKPCPSRPQSLPLPQWDLTTVAQNADPRRQARHRPLSVPALPMTRRLVHHLQLLQMQLIQILRLLQIMIRILQVKKLPQSAHLGVGKRLLNPIIQLTVLPLRQLHRKRETVMHNLPIQTHLYQKMLRHHLSVKSVKPLSSGGGVLLEINALTLMLCLVVVQ